MFDDFTKDPSKVYEEALSFLNVPSDGKETFAKINENKRIRNRWAAYLKRLYTSDQRQFRAAINLLKKVTGIQDWGVRRTIIRVTDTSPTVYKRNELDAEFRGVLREHFRPQIGMLEELLDRNLDCWQ